MPLPDWGAMFSSTAPALEVVARCTILHLTAIVMLRVIGQRVSGGLTVTDLLVVILVGEALAHAMSRSGYLSVPEGLLLAATLLAWSVGLDARSYRFAALGRALKARPRPLIEDGKLNLRALRREFLSREEVDAQLRLHGVEDVRQVRRAHLEPNGMISVFTRTPGATRRRSRHPR